MYRALCLACCLGSAAGQLSVTPGKIAVQTPRQGSTLRELHLESSASAPVNVSLRVRFSGSGRGSGRKPEAPAEAPESVNADVPPFRAIAAKSEKCKLLLKLRQPEQHGEHSAALRRRLKEDPRLSVKSWSHLTHVDIDVVELDCALASDANASMAYVKETYGSDVKFVETDRPVYATDFVGMPSDPRWPEQWGMQRVGVGKAWEELAGKGPAWRKVTVAVIDTGVMLGHEDLQGRLWTNHGEIPGNGIDDDGNGFVDDVHGYDFVDEDGNPEDEGGHGTHCAGVIAAAADNGVGVAGVAGRHVAVEIMALRFLGGSGGGSTSDAIRALDYALAMGVPISSNSWGGEDDGTSLSLKEAMSAAGDRGHLFVAAAGNDGANVDDKLYTPCGFTKEKGLCVASTTKNEELSSFSNYGLGRVHIAAPGSNILSTYMGGGYRVLSGTSMACPHVAGAAALMYGSMVSSTPQEVRDLILASAVRKPWLKNKTMMGLLDVDRLVSHVSAATWLSFRGNASTELRVESGSNVTVPLTIGLDGAPVGTYSAEVLVEWANGSAAVPVSYRLQGSPKIETEWGRSLVLDFGTVPLGSKALRNASMHNVGNGTSKLRFGEVRAPFALASKVMEMPAFARRQLFFSCEPGAEGLWEENVTVESNDGTLEPSDNTVFTTSYGVTLRCRGKVPPKLEMEKYSGVSLAETGRFLEPSVHAAWEVDLPGGSAKAQLALAEEREGCKALGGKVSGKILLVVRGGCYFQQKALLAAEAGALGLVIYDKKKETTLESLASVKGLPLPSIAAFLISKDEGEELARRIEKNETVEVDMHWDSLTMWTNHPTFPDSSSARLSNHGAMAFEWSASLLGRSQAEFYKASLPRDSFKWTTASESDALPFFTNRYVDDESTAVTLPFAFPFYGKHHRELLVSSNGILVFDPNYGAKGSGTYGSIPSTQAPNGVIAAFWDDLVCDHSSRLYMLRAEDSVVFQFANFTFYGSPSDKKPRVSFEARLFASGQVDVHYLDFPPLRANTKFGVETLDGKYGKDFVTLLPFEGGRPFTARLSPWFVPETSSGVLALSQSETLRFRASGDVEHSTWLKVAAKDASGAWSAKRKVRLQSKVFNATWLIGDWGSCGSGNIRHRSVRCVGNDGLEHPFSYCAERKVCKDVPGWKDSRGLSCGYYTEQRDFWADFEIDWLPDSMVPSMDACTARFASRGYWSQTACCACGGGLQDSLYEVPAANETCNVTAASGSMVLRLQTAEAFLKDEVAKKALQSSLAVATGVAPQQVSLRMRKEERFLQTGIVVDFSVERGSGAALQALKPAVMTPLLLEKLKALGSAFTPEVSSIGAS